MQVIESHIYEALDDFIHEHNLVDALSVDVVEAVMIVLPRLPSVHLCQVEEFHQVFGHPVAKEATLIGEARFAFRMRMLLEEMSELAAACGPHYIEAFRSNLVEAENNIGNYHVKVSAPEDAAKDVLDALVDIQYFLDGTIVEFGMQETFNAAFTEVHDSNMSKVVNTVEQAEESVDAYKDRGVEAGVKWVTLEGELHPKYGVVYRIEDDKILKSIAWHPADLTGYVKPFKNG